MPGWERSPKEGFQTAGNGRGGEKGQGWEGEFSYLTGNLSVCQRWAKPGRTLGTRCVGRGRANRWGKCQAPAPSPVHHDAKGARHTKKSHGLRYAPGSAPSGHQLRPERLTDLASAGARGARESPRRRDREHTLR